MRVRCKACTRALLAAVLSWCPLAAFAQPYGPPPVHGVEDTWTGFFSLGSGIGLSGTVMQDGVGTIGDEPAVFVEQSIGHHYSDPLKIRFGGSLGLDYNKEVFASFGYGRFNATERLVGSVGGFPLYTRFSSARAIDLEGGLRYYLQPQGPVRTYVAGVVGLRFLEQTEATLRIVELGLTFQDVDYFDASTLFIFGGDVGISRDLSDRLAIAGEIGLRYQPKPGQESFGVGSGFEDINDTGSRWSLPLSVLAMWRF